VVVFLCVDFRNKKGSKIALNVLAYNASLDMQMCSVVYTLVPRRIQW